jgi:hypothetical protein
MPVMLLRSFAFGAAFACALPAAALATEYAVIGDSLGVGVSWAAKPPVMFAKNSIAIHGGAILAQINSLPRGVTAFMSLGTNDAVGGAVDVKKPVQDILAAAAARNVKLVWLGPPCVFKPWNKYALQLDANLRSLLKDTSVIYVGMHDADVCNPSLRGREGVHFTMAGYTVMWRKAAEAAGFPVVVAGAEKLASLKDNQKKRPSPKRHRKRKPPSLVAPAPKPEAAPGAT